MLAGKYKLFIQLHMEKQESLPGQKNRKGFFCVITAENLFTCYFAMVFLEFSNPFLHKEF